MIFSFYPRPSSRLHSRTPPPPPLRRLHTSQIFFVFVAIVRFVRRIVNANVSRDEGYKVGWGGGGEGAHRESKRRQNFN